MSLSQQITSSPSVFNKEHGADVRALFPQDKSAFNALVVATASCSPFLRGLLIKHRDWMIEVCDSDPNLVLETLCADLSRQDGVAIEQRLRLAKSRMSLYVALCDLGGVWSLEEVTSALTVFADASVQTTMAHLFDGLVKRGKFPWLDAENALDQSGWTAIAMGKMGAGELNYSSDIDLIMLFDESIVPTDAFEETRMNFVRQTRAMHKILNQTTGDGYVFRTDLRLRPDPSVTPVCLSMGAAERYYEALGRSWERAAYIKARACAGDTARGTEYLGRLRPFVWRRHLDFAAIQDAHDMRLKIREHKRLGDPKKLSGANVKLGRGGIREIEFFAQTRQIVAGGRDEALRVRGTVQALDILTEKGWVEPGISKALAGAYRRHRVLEHRLQMIADAQTHSLPTTPEDFDRLAAFMGVKTSQLREQVMADFEMVHSLTEAYFAPQKKPHNHHEDDAHLAKIIDEWRSYPAFRSERAGQILERLQDGFLERAHKTPDPNATLLQFSAFLQGLPSGVQVLSLFDANPQLVDLLMDICGASEHLAAYLARHAQVLDAVIGGEFFAPLPDKALMASELATKFAAAPDYEDKLNAARRWKNEQHFRISVHLLRGLASTQEAAAGFSHLACAVVSQLWQVVAHEFSTRHGCAPGRGGVILGMGSLGAETLSAASDLDLILIYDAQGIEVSDGPRPLDVPVYYARLSKMFVTALTAPLPDGHLYEVDMRLRPSGRQGPVAITLNSFREYQMNEAWTWEHMALTRAQVICGNADLSSDVADTRKDVIAMRRDEKKTITDVIDMRLRLEEAKTGVEDGVKSGAGSMLDIGLVAQTNALLSGSLSRNTQMQLSNPSITGLTVVDAEVLIEVDQFLTKIRQLQSLFGLKDGSIRDIAQAAMAVFERETECKNVSDLGDAISANKRNAARVIANMLEAFEEREIDQQG